MKISYLLLFICFFLIGLSQSIGPNFKSKFNRKLEDGLEDTEKEPKEQIKEATASKGKEKIETTTDNANEMSSPKDAAKDETKNEAKDKTKDETKKDNASPTNSGKEVTVTTKEPNQNTTVVSTESADVKQKEAGIEAIRSRIEKYRLLDKKSYSELCSDNVLDKKVLKTLHLSDNNFILILDEYNLTLKLNFVDNSYYPRITKLPYRCTSFCQSKTKNGTASNYTTINRFKYDKYLVELLGSKDYIKVTFYFEDLSFLESEKEQDKHLTEALVFTVQRDGCTPPIGNPKLLDVHFDNPVTTDLIQIFCDNKETRDKFIDNEEFLIEDLEETESIFKDRNIIFFTYPVISSFTLNTDNKTSSKNKMKKNNLANAVKDIKNAVQLKENDNLDKFIVFNDQQMYVLRKQETQLVEQSPTYSIQNYFSCPEPLCLDSYFDTIFPIKHCDFDSLFDFLPKTGKLFIAFRGTYFYLMNKVEQLNAPKIDQAIPIDYLFKEVLNRTDIDFNYVSAGTYVKKSDVLILFKDDKYLLLDPSNKIVNGPFNTTETFKYSKGSPDTVYMDDDYLVIIEGKDYVKYSWKASTLAEKRIVNLVEFISLESKSTIDQELDFVLSAIYKERDTYNIFINDNLIELEFDQNGDKKVKVMDVSSEYFSNCATVKKNAEKTRKENLTNLDGLYESLRDRRDVGKSLEMINGTDTPSNQTHSNSTTGNTSSPINSSYLVHLIGLTIVLVNLLNLVGAFF